MRNDLLLVAAILVAPQSSFTQETSAAPQAQAAATSAMKLDDATPVLLRVKQDLSSASAKVGDRVPFRVSEDVKVGDLTVIHRRAKAWGVVTSSGFPAEQTLLNHPHRI
jgi:hypothetical protein